MYRKKFKPEKKYKIYYKKTVWKPLKFKSYGWKRTKNRLDWFKKKGIKAYAKKIQKGGIKKRESSFNDKRNSK